MVSTSKAFKRFVDPCPRYLTPDVAHGLRVFCLVKEHAHDVLEGAICVHCEHFSMRKLRFHLSLFEEGGAAICFPRFRAHCCRGTEENELVGLTGKSGRWVREGTHRPWTRVSCWIMMMRSLWHHLIQRLALFWVLPRKSRRCLEGEEVETEPSH